MAGSTTRAPYLRGGRLRALAVAGLVVLAAGAAGPSAHLAHAAALTPCAGSTVPFGTVYLAGWQTLSSSVTTPAVSAASNVMYVQLTDHNNPGCTYTGTIDNSGQFTLDGAQIAVLAAGDYYYVTTINSNISEINGDEPGVNVSANTTALTDCSVNRDSSGAILPGQTAAYCAPVSVTLTGGGTASRNVPCNVDAYAYQSSDAPYNPLFQGETKVTIDPTTGVITVKGRQSCSQDDQTFQGSEAVFVDTTRVTSTPELGSADLLAIGAVPLGLLYLRRRRRKA